MCCDMCRCMRLRLHWCLQGVTITIKDELVSKPYVDMTIKLMQKFGVTVEQLDGLQKLRIPGQQAYKSPGTIFVEGDASSASYFLAGATITGGKIRVVGCGSESVQVWRRHSTTVHAPVQRCALCFLVFTEKRFAGRCALCESHGAHGCHSGVGAECNCAHRAGRQAEGDRSQL